MDAETGFLIDGTVYEVPDLDALTMSERRVMYELAGVIQEDFVQIKDETDEEYEERTDPLTRNPGFMEALMHIAYQRGNPTLKPGKVKLVIDRTDYYEAVETLASATPPEEDAVPLALTTPPDEPSSSAPSSLTDSSAPTPEPGGTPSTNDSEGLVKVPTHIGTLRSATSSPESPPTESVG